MNGLCLTVDAVTTSMWPSPHQLRAMLLKAVHAGNATPLELSVIELPHPHKSRPSSPPGGTAWVGLDESHVTLHWYSDRPKLGSTLFALDVFTCGEHANTHEIMDTLMLLLAGKALKQNGHKRFVGID
jgi:S-adenosylmethionine/arginine decarboxylase-like enzyme